MDRTVHVFTSNTCKIVHCKSEAELDAWRQSDNAVVNYDFSSLVQQAPSPHFWKLLAGKVYPMRIEEIKARQEDIRRNGLDERIIQKAPPEIKTKVKWLASPPAKTRVVFKLDRLQATIFLGVGSLVSLGLVYLAQQFKILGC